MPLRVLIFSLPAAITLSFLVDALAVPRASWRRSAAGVQITVYFIMRGDPS